MSFFLKSGLVLMLGLMLSACGGKAPSVDPTEAKTEEKAEAEKNSEEWKKAWAFELSEGMSRADVEAAMGKPAHSGWTKEGNPYVMYSPEGAPDGYYRSVVYSKEGKVITWYR